MNSVAKPANPLLVFFSLSAGLALISGITGAITNDGIWIIPMVFFGLALCGLIVLSSRKLI